MTARAIIALDVPTLDEALRLVETLGDSCRFYKVGSQLFTAAGPDAVRRLRAAGCDVFLDLKVHDIPNTARGAVRSAAALGARLVTVHASGGQPMLEAAVRGAEEGGTGSTPCDVMAVTVLTSIDAGGLATSWGRDPLSVRDEVLRLAAMARAARVPGVVCGGSEAAAVRAAHGSALSILVPGIRLAEGGGAGARMDDQARVVTPREAAAAGADYLVLGRAVTGAPDPRVAMQAVLAELAGP
jgi:orotidine-5'-phosphate decarboxylase